MSEPNLKKEAEVSRGKKKKKPTLTITWPLFEIIKTVAQLQVLIKFKVSLFQLTLFTAQYI